MVQIVDRIYLNFKVQYSTKEKKMKILTLFFAMFLTFGAVASAEETATPQEIFDMVVKGAYLLENLGEEGLAAFNDPDGELAWKDTYVQVYNCKERQIPGHPSPAVRAFTPEKFWNLQDSSSTYICRSICDAAKNANGGWVEYQWPKLGETEPSRKITFVTQVPNTPWQVSAGIYDENVSLEELNSKWKVQ
ncbi:MAG TPA: cache domain-containing protein [Geopsychrobacteraceae bacterium]|nr:cache domain-containing protein [Geopsychrobacteraceae bacterium]